MRRVRLSVCAGTSRSAGSFGTQASIFGTATINGSGSFEYQIDVHGPRRARHRPTRTGSSLSNGYDSGVQTLDGGNVQIH